jgi:hypothetical protein
LVWLQLDQHCVIPAPRTLMIPMRHSGQVTPIGAD